MPLPDLSEATIALRVDAADWREAIRAAGALLTQTGATDEAYTQRMIDVVEEFGAYVVIAPGLALAHARPGADVHQDSLVVATLTEPVRFGHPHNDPVSVVLGLAVTTAESHVGWVAEIANVFNDPTAIPRLAAAADADEVRAVFRAELLGHGGPA
ncbi:PTS sugar transporter subunit IIA [Plantibacter sp. Leaf314]|uniref:PTS sugar transporter subunit IIA n=1 Tax=Plantibacter sp. Leaf314 TaxID=1736333 RepID=UPI0006FB11C9|nr:PTS sugar transporter subunit IIA [Plantibacter sp. Leaf314]KQQ50414.1 PTS ascorbate transporter subunit IIA [Plantibacter sp. Leaf314]